MEQYAIWGGNPLVGEVEIGGAKNAALPILAAAIMTDDTVIIDNLPDIRDINVLLQAMQNIPPSERLFFQLPCFSEDLRFIRLFSLFHPQHGIKNKHKNIINHRNIRIMS